MFISSIIFCLLYLQTFSLRIPSRYFKSLSKNENISDEAKDKILKSLLKFLNEVEEDIIDNRTKPDNRTDNRTKPDNRTDNRTKPDNRTDPKPDNRTVQKPELVGINTKAIQYLSWQNISLVFSNNDTNLSLIENLVAWTKNKPSNTLKLRCFEKENNYTIKCIGDFSRIQTGIYIVNSLGYNHSSITLPFPITFYVQKRSGYLY